MSTCTAIPRAMDMPSAMPIYSCGQRTFSALRQPLRCHRVGHLLRELRVLADQRVRVRRALGLLAQRAHPLLAEPERALPVRPRVVARDEDADVRGELVEPARTKRVEELVQKLGGGLPVNIYKYA